MSLASIFKLESKATQTPAPANDTLHFGSGQCPRVPIARLRASCAGFPLGRVTYGRTDHFGAWIGQHPGYLFFSTRLLQTKGHAFEIQRTTHQDPTSIGLPSTMPAKKMGSPMVRIPPESSPIALSIG